MSQPLNQVQQNQASHHQKPHHSQLSHDSSESYDFGESVTSSVDLEEMEKKSNKPFEHTHGLSLTEEQIDQIRLEQQQRQQQLQLQNQQQPLQNQQHQQQPLQNQQHQQQPQPQQPRLRHKKSLSGPSAVPSESDVEIDQHADKKNLLSINDKKCMPVISELNGVINTVRDRYKQGHINANPEFQAAMDDYNDTAETLAYDLSDFLTDADARGEWEDVVTQAFGAGLKITYWSVGKASRAELTEFLKNKQPKKLTSGITRMKIYSNL